MITPGLVSITFRQLSPREVVDLARRCGLQAIEWGGDIHVPHGDLARAREVGGMTTAAGLDVAAYGSYYRVGESENEGPAFDTVLETALALGAATVRVWAGKKGSVEAGEAYRAVVVSESRRIAGLAAAAGLTVSYEFHNATLTDTNESARRLLDEVDHEAVRTLWQPPNGVTVEYCLDGLSSVLPLVSNVHVFHWGTGWKDRYPLAEGADRWQRYLALLAAGGREHYALIEFVKDDDPAQLAGDADALTGWLARIERGEE